MTPRPTAPNTPGVLAETLTTKHSAPFSGEMLNWMLRTWWVQVAFGVLFAAGTAASSDARWDARQWALVLLQIVIAGAFFFEAGVLWARAKSKIEVGADR